MDPKKAIATAMAAALLGSSITLPGCTRPIFSNTNPIRYERGTIPTERQIQIARDFGVAEKVIQEEYLVDGLDSTSFDRIMHAEHMLDHVEEKYGETFKPNWITAPGWGQRNYELNVTVMSGEHEGATCTVKYYWKEVEEPFYLDSYFYVLKHEEYEDYLRGLLKEVYGGTPGGVGVAEVMMVNGATTDAYGPETGFVKGIPGLGGHIYIYFPPTCELTEEEYYALKEEFLDLLAAKGIDVQYQMMVITKVREKHEGKPFTLNVAQLARSESTEENPTYKWRILSSVSEERSVQK